jgi:hypothetical protein
MEGSEMSKVIKNVHAASVSRIIGAAGFENAKAHSSWSTMLPAFEVYQGGWNGKEKSYAEVHFYNGEKGNAFQIVQIAHVLREAGYFVVVHEKINKAPYWVQGERFEKAYEQNYIMVYVENPVIAAAKREVEKAQYVLNKAQEKLAEVMAEVEAAVA